MNTITLFSSRVLFAAFFLGCVSASGTSGARAQLPVVPPAAPAATTPDPEVQVIAPSKKVGFGVMPMETEVRAARAGARVSGDIEVFNAGEVPLFISGTITDQEITRDGDVKFSDPGTSRFSCSQWVKLNPVEFAIQPHKSVRVRYSITTPVNLTEARSTMVIFSSRPMAGVVRRNMSLPVVYRIASRIWLLPTVEIEPRATISKIAVGERNTVLVSVENPTLRHVVGNGTAQALDRAGRLVASGTVKNVKMMPLGGRDMPIAWDKPLDPGKYIVRTVIDYGGKQLAGSQASIEVAALPAPVPPPADSEASSDSPLLETVDPNAASNARPDAAATDAGVESAATAATATTDLKQPDPPAATTAPAAATVLPESPVGGA